MKSKPHPLNGQGLIIGCSKLAGAICISPYRWQASHPLLYRMQSSTIVGQYKPALLNVHFILWADWCTPHNPSCTSPITTHACSVFRHFNNNPSIMCRYSSSSIMVYFRACLRAFLSVTVLGFLIHSFIRSLQSSSLPYCPALVSPVDVPPSALGAFSSPLPDVPSFPWHMSFVWIMPSIFSFCP
jgi:hypothetical protein